MVERPFPIVVFHRDDTRDVLPESTQESAFCERVDNADVIGEQARLGMLESCLFASNREPLAWRTSGDEVDVRKFVQV
jgi:hypothetical protein